MRYEVFPGGFSCGKNTHLSVYIRILRGEYDNNLNWPFKGDTVVEMYNWTLKVWTHTSLFSIIGKQFHLVQILRLQYICMKYAIHS